jgi:hypothetical protein
VTRWMSLIGLLLLVLGCQGSCRRGPVSYQSMHTCYSQVPIVMTLGGEAKNMIVPRVREGRLQVLTLFSSWWPQLGPFVHAPRNAVVADAEENELVERFDLDATARAGVPTGAVPQPEMPFSDLVGVFRDMDLVIPDFAEGRLPTSAEGKAALERLRTEYPRTMAKEHVIVYERLSPAWFAFLRGEADFASKGHT